MFNKWVGLGRLGSDPVSRQTPSGDTVCEFSIAVDETYKDKNGDKVTKTEWLKIIAWRKLGEICGNFLCKGKLVLIEGKIQTEQWSDKDGVKRTTTKIIASNMQMLDGKRKEEQQEVAEEPMGDCPF